MSILGASGWELVRATQNGEIAALGTLIERHRPALFAVALGLMRDAPAAQDAVQDASLIALRRLSRFVILPPSARGFTRSFVGAACRSCAVSGRAHGLSHSMPGSRWLIRRLMSMSLSGLSLANGCGPRSPSCRRR